MAERWFQVPVVTNPSWSIGSQVPKYADTNGIDQVFSCQIVTVNGTDYYLVRFYGTTSALDTVEGNSDATSLQESGLTKSDIASYLNSATGHSYTFSEWEKRFFI